MSNEAREFQRRLNMPGATKEHIHGGKRTMDVKVSIRGVEIARKTILYKRGKVAGETYFFPRLNETQQWLTGIEEIKPGERVRCAYRGEHTGVVLERHDPRAWANTIAFPVPDPDPNAVREHVALPHIASVLATDNQPVLWDFDVPRVYWDSQLSRVEPLSAPENDRAARLPTHARNVDLKIDD